MKIDRLLSILMLIINKKKVTAKELANYFEVNIRTIQRDMDTLSLAGVPIFAEVGKNGGYRLIEDFKFEKSFLNKNEAKILVSFLKSLETTVPYQEVKSIYNKFSTIFSDDFSNNKIVIKLNPLVDDKSFKKNIDNLSKARDNLQKVEIDYIDIDFKNSKRIVSPYFLLMWGSVWYIYGFCDLRKDFRLFKITRIISSRVLDINFELIKLENLLPWETQLEGNRKTTKILLEIDENLQGKIPDYFNYRDCKIKDGKIKVVIDYPVDEWLYSLLFSLVPYIRIVEPDFIREEFIKRLKKSIGDNEL
ncbi:MAG: YafY family protein [Clostridiales bacterium]